METYISLLRGINVSGKNLIKMTYLQQMYEDLGFKNVKTYIQSGNVVFQAKEMNTEELEKTITSGILKTFKLDVSIIVLEQEELTNILEHNPFINRDISRLYFTVISRLSDKIVNDKIVKEAYLPDEFEIIDRTVYLYCPKGFGQTKLNNNFFEKKLNVRATTRNMKTMMELMKICNNY